MWKQEHFNYRGKKQSVSGRVVFRCYIELMTEFDKVYAEIQDFVESRLGKMNIKIKDVLRFQKRIMITPDYKKGKGKYSFYFFDHHDYFKYYQKNNKLKFRPNVISFSDKAMGPAGNEEIDTSSLSNFLKTVGNGTRLLPHFYTHQLPKSKTLKFFRCSRKH